MVSRFVFSDSLETLPKLIVLDEGCGVGQGRLGSKKCSMFSIRLRSLRRVSEVIAANCCPVSPSSPPVAASQARIQPFFIRVMPCWVDSGFRSISPARSLGVAAFSPPKGKGNDGLKCQRNTHTARSWSSL